MSESTHYPECPHCGKADTAWWVCIPVDAEHGHEQEHECPHCELLYKVIMYQLVRTEKVV